MTGLGGSRFCLCRLNINGFQFGKIRDLGNPWASWEIALQNWWTLKKLARVIHPVTVKTGTPNQAYFGVLKSVIQPCANVKVLGQDESLCR
jgi:hypothetical protein